MLDHAPSEIVIGSKLGIDATKKLPGKGFKRASPPLMDAASFSDPKYSRASVQAEIESR